MSSSASLNDSSSILTTNSSAVSSGPASSRRNRYQPPPSAAASPAPPSRSPRRPIALSAPPGPLALDGRPSDPPPVPGSQRPLAPDSRSPDPPPADGVSPSEEDPVSSGGLPCRAVELYPRRSGAMRVIFCRTIKSLPTTRDESRHLSRSCPGRETGIVGRSWSSPGQVPPSGPGVVSGCRIHK
jgi:hypothetical protein